MSDHRRLERSNGEAGAHRKQTERDDEGHGPPAQKHNRKRGGDGQSRRRPPFRLSISCKINDDPGAEGHRKPRQQPAGADFDRSLFAIRTGTAKSTG